MMIRTGFVGQLCACAPVGFSDQQKIGIQEVANHAAKRNKFGAVAQTEINSGAFATGFFERLPHIAAGRARHHRARERYNVILPFGGKRAADRFAHREYEAQRKAAVRDRGSGYHDKSDV